MAKVNSQRMQDMGTKENMLKRLRKWLVRRVPVHASRERKENAKGKLTQDKEA